MPRPTAPGPVTWATDCWSTPGTGPTVAWAAEPDGELPFIMGQLMVFRRPALDAVGGVGCAEGQFVDDMYIGKRIAAAGWKNVVVESPLRVVTGGMGPWTFLRTFRRWILFSESGLPFRFTRPNWVRGVACWLAWGVGIAAVVTGDWASAALGAMAIGTSVWTQAWLQRACHGPRLAVTQLWVPAVLPLVSAFVALSARLNRRVDWRGRSYDLDAEARLGAKGSPAAGREPGGPGDGPPPHRPSRASRAAAPRRPAAIRRAG